MHEDTRLSALPPRRHRGGKAYAALDLGTNNCRLLVARRGGDSFVVVDSFSRIVRLGEGLAASGRLGDAAMERALGALKICARKLADWRIEGQRCIATQACRIAANGEEFLSRVARETGLRLSVISPREEAELAVLGCGGLIDPTAEAALIVDIGGGSTELSWVEASTQRILAWTSLPFGVVTLAERHGDEADADQVYRAMIADVREAVRPFRDADALRAVFAAGKGHLLGTSGAVTSLAAVNMGLSRYRRSAVDGVWLSADDARRTAETLRLAGRQARARNGCIGPDRADLVVPGAAILEALLAEWPASRVRVADRGLREGMLISLMDPR
jgi:exopolyphosphatase / guanosine-5'-triphosphate,3'-diphosphate pyrophosphatase